MATQGTATLTATNTTVVVDHTYGSTDFIALLTPLDDLGGRDYWVTTKTSTQFTINISSLDFGDHEFDWLLTEEITEAVEEDHYSTVQQVKAVLRIAESRVDHDTEILDCIIDVDEELKVDIESAGLTAPASASTTSYPLINKASYYLAAYEFRDRGSENTGQTETQKQKFYDKGRTAIDKYIEANKEIGLVVAEADST